MANKFPHVEVIGVDLVLPALNEHGIPDNCRFELDDVNREIPRFYGQIDLIHQRAVCSGVSPRHRLPTHLALSSQLSRSICHISQHAIWTDPSIHFR